MGSLHVMHFNMVIGESLRAKCLTSSQTIVVYPTFSYVHTVGVGLVVSPGTRRGGLDALKQMIVLSPITVR